jgi:S1-C subfamily serine protease
MKKAVYGLVAAACVGALIVGATATLRAQSRSFTLAPLTFDGAGSAIGVTVEDGDAAGARVTGVSGDMPASRAGVAEGDVVVEFDGERVRSAQQFARLVRETAPGRAVEMSVLRDGARRQLPVIPEQRGAVDRAITVPTAPQAYTFSAPFRGRAATQPFENLWIFPGNPARLGVSVAPVSGQLAEYFGVTGGVLVQEVVEDSPAARAGLRAGDVIREVDGTAVSTQADVVSAIGRAGDGASLEIQITRDRQDRRVTATLPERERPQAPRIQVTRPV